MENAGAGVKIPADSQQGDYAKAGFVICNDSYGYTEQINTSFVTSLKHTGERLRRISLCTVRCFGLYQAWFTLMFNICESGAQQGTSVTPHKKITLHASHKTDMRDVPRGVLEKKTKKTPEM